MFDAADLAAESSFWAGVLDGTVDAEDDWHMVRVDGRPGSGFSWHRTTSPPTGRTGRRSRSTSTSGSRTSTAAHERVMSLGARVLKEAEDGDSPDNFQVYADPAGHPFCLCWVKPG